MKYNIYCVFVILFCTRVIAYFVAIFFSINYIFLSICDTKILYMLKKYNVVIDMFGTLNYFATVIKAARSWTLGLTIVQSNKNDALMVKNKLRCDISDINGYSVRTGVDTLYSNDDDLGETNRSYLLQNKHKLLITSLEQMI